MTKSEKQLRKKIIKEKFLRALHIICYILSVLFIIVCIIAGVKSCQGSNSKQQEPNKIQQPLKAINSNNINNYYCYKFKFSLSSSFEIPYDLQSEWGEYYGVDMDSRYTSAQSDYYFSFLSINDGYVIDSDSQQILIDSFSFKFQTFVDEGGFYRYLIFGVYYTTPSDTYYFFLHREFEQADDPDYYVVRPSYPIIFLDIEIVNNDIFSFFFDPIDKTDFIFNQNFNFNAPIGLNNTTPYGSKPGNIIDNGIMPYYEYDTGLFISNNQIFNKIRWQAQETLGAVTVKFSNGDIKKGPDGTDSIVYVWIEYVNSLTNTSVIVNQRVQVAYMPTSSSYGYYWDLSTTWVLDSYRYITFLTDLPQSTLDNIKKFNNNNQNYFGGGGNIGGVSNVFDLLSLAFTSLSDFWSINLLPGISIGTLFFLPLVVAIVLTVFYFVKR